MIPVTGAVTTLLNSSGELYFADLYTLNLLDGNVLYYTSADKNITFGPTTWYAFPPVISADAHGNIAQISAFQRSKIKLTRGVQVDSLSVDVYPSPDDVIGLNPFVQLCVTGGLDGCYLQLDRAVAAGPGSAIVGIIPKRFYGRVADISGGRSKVTLTVKSDLDLLNIQMPRVLFQPPCSHSLYDGGCTLVKSAFTVTGTVTGIGSPNSFLTSMTQADGYFNNGVLTFTSGLNSGLGRTIKTYINFEGTMRIILPFPQLVTVGDAFSIYPGCDKKFVTCDSKFSNSQNFRGFEFIPNPESALI